MNKEILKTIKENIENGKFEFKKDIYLDSYFYIEADGFSDLWILGGRK